MEGNSQPTLPEALALDVDAAFPSLMADLADPVYSLALRMCGRDEAEDVAQEAFVRAYRALSDASPDQRRELRLRPWVLTIALNVARNHLRTAGRRPRRSGHDAPAEAADTAAAPDAAAEGSETRAELAAALLRLPVASRETVVLRHVVGCRTADVAVILDRPVGTVKAQISRGLAALRHDLQQNGLAPERHPSEEEEEEQKDDG